MPSAIFRSAERITLCCVLICALAFVTSAPATEPPELDELLSRLDGVAQTYRQHALRFTCEETILHDPGYRKRVLRFQYIYAYSEEEGLRDYRLPRYKEKKRMGKKQLARRSEVVELADYDLPTWLSRAYSWIFLFEAARHDRFRYSIVGEEEVLGRPAVQLRFEPLPPYETQINDWVGTAWVDRQSFQILRVEALKLHHYWNRQRLEEDLQQAPGWNRAQQRLHAIHEVSTDYGVEKQGIRFPSEVTLQESLYLVRGGRRVSNVEEYPGMLIRQSYDNYRIYGVSTSGRLGKYLGQ